MKRRLNYLIYPQFQLSLLLVNFIANIFLFGFLKTRILFYFHSLIQRGQDAGLKEEHIFFKFINNQLNTLDNEFLLALIISLLFSSILTLWLSHRMAGPIIRLRNHLTQTIVDGSYRNVKFRKNDYFQEIPDLLNRAFEKLTHKK